MSLSGIGTGSGSSASVLVGNMHSLQQKTMNLLHQSGASSISHDSVSLSGQGQFLSKLQALQASNPQKFKTVLTQAANELQAAAKREGNTPRGRALADLAQKFQNVANGGDISQLQPTAPTNRVQKAYGANSSDSVQGLLNLLNQNSTATAINTAHKQSLNVPAGSIQSRLPSSGPDPHHAVKSVLNSLNTAIST